MDTWDIHIKERMPGVDPIEHIRTQYNTYTVAHDQFLITEEIKTQVQNYVKGHFRTGLQEGPYSKAWRLVGKIFLLWPSYKYNDFENPICVVYENDKPKVLTGITRLWAKTLHYPDFNFSKALTFHNIPQDGALSKITDASGLFLKPLDNMLISVDLYPESKCFFINEFDSLSRNYMQLYLAKDNNSPLFAKYWTRVHELGRDLNLKKGSIEHIVQSTKILLNEIS